MRSKIKQQEHKYLHEQDPTIHSSGEKIVETSDSVVRRDRGVIID